MNTRSHCLTRRHTPFTHASLTRLAAAVLAAFCFGLAATSHALPLPAESVAPPAGGDSDAKWQSLFNGKNLQGWTVTDFAGRGEVSVTNGMMVLEMGDVLTGVNWTDTNSLPKTNYEVALDAEKLDGSDFMLALTFPFQDTACSLILGGWGGGVVGISSINGEDASLNETTKFMNFEKNRWYHVRVRVTPHKIEAWLDKEKIVDLDTSDKNISMRPGEIELSMPFGLATYQTKAAYRNIKIHRLTPAKSGE